MARDISNNLLTLIASSSSPFDEWLLMCLNASDTTDSTHFDASQVFYYCIIADGAIGYRRKMFQSLVASPKDQPDYEKQTCIKNLLRLTTLISFALFSENGKTYHTRAESLTHKNKSAIYDISLDCVYALHFTKEIKTKLKNDDALWRGTANTKKCSFVLRTLMWK